MADQGVVVIQQEVGGWWHAANQATTRSSECIASQQQPIKKAPGGAVAQSRFMGKTAKPIYAEAPVSGAPDVKNLPQSLKRKPGRTCDDTQPPKDSSLHTSQWVWNLDDWKWEHKKQNNTTKDDVNDILARRWGNGRDSLISSATVTTSAPHTTSTTPVEELQHRTKAVKIVRSRKDPADRGFASVGGFSHQKSILIQSVILPLRYPSLYKHVGVHPSRGILLHGPTGSGKTHLIKALAHEANIHIEHVNGAECVGSTAAEDRLRRAFTAAKNAAPCILFIDEIDAVAPSRSTPGTSDVERQSTALVLSLIDSLRSTMQPQMTADGHHHNNNNTNKHIALIAASNRPDAIDIALRRPGRLDIELPLNAPNRSERVEILECLTKNMKINDGVDVCRLSERLQGYMAADIAGCVVDAGVRSVSDAVTQNGCYFDEKTTITNDQYYSDIKISSHHFDDAINNMHPAILRNSTADIPNDVTWNDVSGLATVKQELQELIEWPINHSHIIDAMGLSYPKGALLYGPPGCGKTMIAKAIAASCNVNFISIRGPELLDKWVGESERAIRELFDRARIAAPCIIFFDEIDAIATRRNSGGGGGGGSGGVMGDAVVARVLNQLLCEMDGIQSSSSSSSINATNSSNTTAASVFVLAATNRPGAIDPSLLRPGRLDKIIKIPLPDIHARESILQKVLNKCPLSHDVDLMEVASRDEMVGMSGADVAEVGKKAGMLFVREMIDRPDINNTSSGGTVGGDGCVLLQMRHIEAALQCTRRSVSEEVSQWYDEIEEKLMNGSLTEEESDPFTHARYKQRQMAMVAEMVRAACERKAVVLEERVKQLEGLLRDAGVEVPEEPLYMDVDEDERVDE